MSKLAEFIRKPPFLLTQITYLLHFTMIFVHFIIYSTTEFFLQNCTYLRSYGNCMFAPFLHYRFHTATAHLLIFNKFFNYSLNYSLSFSSCNFSGISGLFSQVSHLLSLQFLSPSFWTFFLDFFLFP